MKKSMTYAVSGLVFIVLMFLATLQETRSINSDITHRGSQNISQQAPLRLHEEKAAYYAIRKDDFTFKIVLSAVASLQVFIVLNKFLPIQNEKAHD
ncbi:hypothetical protein G7062_10040 [Erysipelothrix sp. HDW6C]|uniref:hypothetical protein n=1 Tax=Erysipelothrix sp. HDW6C TaxID=2714930 RepID=UPI00140B4123|nr:hypothetical protein [Erysipelothrix sp. HDW6C]QIK70621.1 hypothetical protein G7062_10040 [Erysipelothrix sp. HDW6C]